MPSTTKRLSVLAGIAAVRAGEIIVYPTESVFGFGCDPGQQSAIKKIMTLKKREETKGFILIISDSSALESYVDWDKCPQERWQVVENSWPGPVTWVLPARAGVNPLLLGPNQTIAIRMPRHPVANALCQTMGGAIVSTSVNISAQDPLMQADVIDSYFSAAIAGIVAGELGQEHKPSWVIDFSAQTILRSGSDKKVLTGLRGIL